MHITRRAFGLGAVAAGLAGCTQSVTRGSIGSAALPPDLLPARNPGYDAWVAGFEGRAARQGITSATFERSFRNAGFLPGVIDRDRNQAEFSRTLEDYLSIAASDKRVENGRAAFARHRSTLEALQSRFGVDAQIICAIWGMESSYGERQGNIPVISATSTLAYEGRRGQFFESQLIAALKIIQAGDIDPEHMTGSWAGAMGHTQFIPTSFLAFAVDFTGDGRRDIWSADPTDALASAASLLSRNGWVRGMRWGEEYLGGAASGSLIQPQPGGPRFAVTKNFSVIKRYNNSDSYAIGVGHLSDRIAGGGPLRTPFPPDKYGMTKDDRIALQARLTRAGHDTGGTDGVLGPKSREAISSYQRSRGLPVTGEPSLDLLRMLG